MKASVASKGFLSKLAKLSDSGHEHRMGAVLEQHGLQAKITTSLVEIGLKSRHPVLRIHDFLAALSAADKIHEVFLHGHDWGEFASFWERFRKQRPHHPVYRDHKDHLELCIPLFLHCDEGSGPKKKGLMVMQMQPVLAKGSSRAEDINFSGSTFLTRLLYSVLLVPIYAKQKVHLFRLLEHWADDICNAYKNGIEIKVNRQRFTIYPVVLGLKGDLPALIKLGRLNRNFMRDSPSADNPPGICHLCQAGRRGFPWHRTDPDSEWLNDPDAERDPPWSRPSPLLRIPSDVGARLYLTDVFHTLHKGIFGDFAASALAPCPQKLLKCC